MASVIRLNAMSPFRFSLKNIAVAVLVFACVFAWWLDRSRLAAERDTALRQLDAAQKRNQIVADSWKDRAKNVSALAVEDNPLDVPLFLFSLSDPYYKSRNAALRKLSAIRDPRYRLGENFADRNAEGEVRFWISVVESARRLNDTRNEFDLPEADNPANQDPFEQENADPFGDLF